MTVVLTNTFAAQSSKLGLTVSAVLIMLEASHFALSINAPHCNTAAHDLDVANLQSLNVHIRHSFHQIGLSMIMVPIMRSHTLAAVMLSHRDSRCVCSPGAIIHERPLYNIGK